MKRTHVTRTIYKSGSSLEINLVHVVSLHQSSILSSRSHSVSSSSPYISYFAVGSSPVRLATSNAALFSALFFCVKLARDDWECTETYRSSSSSSCLSGKNNRGSSTAKMANDARNRNASPSRNSTSHSRAQASKGRWSRKRGISHSGRYDAGDTWCCLKLKYTRDHVDLDRESINRYMDVLFGMPSASSVSNILLVIR